MVSARFLAFADRNSAAVVVNTGFGTPVDPEVNTLTPGPSSGVTGAPPIERAEASGITSGTRPNRSASGARCAVVGDSAIGVPIGIGGSVRHARGSVDNKMTGDGSDVSATNSATDSGEAATAAAIGRSVSPNRSSTAARHTLAIA